MEVLPVLKWFVALAVLTGLGAPIAAVVFERLPRRGAAFSLPVTLLVMTTVVFLLGQFTFGYHTLAIAVLVVAGFSVVAYRRGGEPEWRAVAGAYGVFLIGFLLYLIYASHNVEITPLGGEQFLHYGLTNALTDAGRLPPEDFWYAGEPLRYYYGTQLQVALLSLLTGTPIRQGYALGLTTFYAILFVSAYGLAGAIVATRGRSYRLGGTLGAIFAAVAGTSTVFLRLLFGWLPEDVTAEYGRAVFFGLVEERGMSFQEAIAEQGTLDGWSWFYARYVVEGGLYEFPLYSFVKADLHGHTLSTGYIVVAGAIAFSYYLTPAQQRGRRLALLYGGLGVVAGVFGFMNTWSLPTAVGLGWLAMVAADAHPGTLLPDQVADSLPWAESDADVSAQIAKPTRFGALGGRLGRELWRVVLAGLLAVPIAVIGIGIASPFLVFGGVPTNEGIGFFPPRTDLGPFLVLYGGLLALFSTYVLARAVLSETRRVHAVGGALVALAALFAFGLGVPVLTVTLPIVAGAWWLVRTDRAGFEAVLLIGGLGLLCSLELVHARVYPFERVRWNTTLKVAVQGWTVAAVAAGGIAALLLSGARDRLATSWERFGDSGPDASGGWRTVRTATPAILVVLVVFAVVVTSLPFGAVTATQYVGSDAFSLEEASIDTLAVHDRWKEEEMEAMYWLDGRDARIVEAPARRAYQWRNVASVFTDARTVAGWNHQEGYRGAAAYNNRASEVESVYTGSWTEAVTVLRKYDVEYIYVGPSERESFEEIRDFREFEGISTAFKNTEVRIYEVDHAALDPSEQDDGRDIWEDRE